MRIYLDYASLTPIDPKVLKEMGRFSSPEYANPSSIYAEGVAAKKAMNEARAKIAGFIHAHPNEIIFTSGGTEANNLAILGAVEFARQREIDYKDMHAVTSVIEHSSVIEAFNYLKSRGVAVDFISVDSNGVVDLKDLKNKLRSNTVIISIMTVNNEIGIIQPIREIAKIIRDFRSSMISAAPANSLSRGQVHKVAEHGDLLDFVPGEKEFAGAGLLFHTDAAQACLHQELNVERLGVDLLTLDGSKIYGPRGIGALYIKRNTPIAPIIHGGGQENGIRPGTENIPAIMGFSKAFEVIPVRQTIETARIDELRALFIQGLKLIRPDIKINGDVNATSPHILNVSIPGINNEFFVLQLDVKGVACSTKSSCLRDEDESHVLKAIGANSRESVRFSFGRWTQKSDVKKAILAIRALLC